MINRNSVVEYLSYTLQSGEGSVELIIDNDTIWATQKVIAEIFECNVSNVVHHISEVFSSGELKRTNEKTIAITKKEGERDVRRNVLFYSLKVVLAVGYRVNSEKAILFRTWANDILEEYTIKGYVLDSKRLKKGAYLTRDYYEDLLEEIRLIRISERRLYQKVTDIFATAIDYNKDSESTYTFFKTVQNKLHYSVTGNTAAEIIYNRADASKEHMGLKTWDRAPSGRIHSTDVLVAKNYLEQNELKVLTQLVTMFLDFAETMATKNIPVTMNDYIRRMDALLELNGRDVLDNPGKVSHEVAEKFALSEFEKYKIIQEKGLVNDFDLFLESPELKEMPILDDKYKEKLKTLLGQEVCGVIDRPIGSKHPKYDDITYQVNYGYINELTAPDGKKQDAYFVGINKPMKEFKGVVIAIIDRIDDIEDKLVVAPLGLDYTDDEIEEAVHFQEQFFKHQIIR